MLVRTEAMRKKVAAAGSVTLDAFTSQTGGTDADPLTTLVHALGATADYALVLISCEDNVTWAVTFGGQTMTAGPTSGFSGASNVFSFWIDAGSLPASGNVDIVADPSAATAAVMGAWSLVGASTGAPNRSDTADSDSGSSAVSLAAVPEGAFIASGNNNNQVSAAPTLAEDGTGGTTERHSGTIGSGGGFQSGGVGDTFVAAEGTVTHTWNHGSTRHSCLMLEVLAG